MESPQSMAASLYHFWLYSTSKSAQWKKEHCIALIDCIFDAIPSRRQAFFNSHSTATRLESHFQLFPVAIGQYMAMDYAILVVSSYNIFPTND